MKNKRPRSDYRLFTKAHRVFRLSVCIILSSFSGIQSATAEESESRPNIVLILIDTLRADLLGCYGRPGDPSPEIDALARDGVRVETVISQSSWTRPSVGSMLTSQYPRTLGLYKEQNEILDDDHVTLAERLQENGYTTIGVTANPVINSAFNMHQGFDSYSDSDVIFSWMKEPTGDGKKKELRRFRQLPTANEVFERAFELLDARADESPTYLQLNLMEIHEAWRPWNSLTRKEFKKLFKGQNGKKYLRALRQTSLDLDAFISRLRKRPGFNDTLFVITSDHGQGMDDHPHVAMSSFHGRMIYTSHVRVPQIFYHPGGELQPGVMEMPIRLLDLLPTLLGYVGLDLPAGLEGVSFAPLLKGEASIPNPPTEFVTETSYRKYRKIGLYTPSWIYIENRDGHRGVNPIELQPRGIQEDGQRTDEGEENPRVLAELKEVLSRWESRHPEVAPTPYRSGLSETQIEQLESIGYLGR
ncbi:MAG: sulfatase [Candidatus Hydrogenedentota bacterium]